MSTKRPYSKPVKILVITGMPKHVYPNGVRLAMFGADIPEWSIVEETLNDCFDVWDREDIDDADKLQNWLRTEYIDGSDGMTAHIEECLPV